MNKQLVEKILLVGPSKMIRDYSKKNFQEEKDNGYKLFAYTGAIEYLRDIEVKPDYYNFADPYTFYSHKRIFKQEYFDKTDLIYVDIYKNNYQSFKNLGFTCNRLKRESPKEYNDFAKMKFLNLFNTSTAIFCDKIYFVEHSETDKINWKEELCLMKHTNKQNTDKFCCWIMPIILKTFTNIKEIKTIGFGDMKVDRNSGGRLGYPEFKTSFLSANKHLKRNLLLNNINLKFVHENYYSKRLE